MVRISQFKNRGVTECSNIAYVKTEPFENRSIWLAPRGRLGPISAFEPQQTGRQRVVGGVQQNAWLIMRLR